MHAKCHSSTALTSRSTLIQHLKESQHNLMTVIMNIMDEAIPQRRASRDFRAKYPDDVLLDQISGEQSMQICGGICISASVVVKYFKQVVNR